MPFRASFPNLTDPLSKQTSPKDSRYNCIAWAFGENRRWWWPVNKPGYFWPKQLSNKSPLEEFEDWFELDGWEPTKEIGFDPSFIKVALFVLNGQPTHAARLLQTGMWTSKLGSDLDLAHGFDELDGPVYGSVFGVYRKPVVALPLT